VTEGAGGWVTNQTIVAVSAPPTRSAASSAAANLGPGTADARANCGAASDDGCNASARSSRTSLMSRSRSRGFFSRQRRSSLRSSAGVVDGSAL
jgi:hypothetical protein